MKYKKCHIISIKLDIEWIFEKFENFCLEFHQGMFPHFFEFLSLLAAIKSWRHNCQTNPSYPETSIKNSWDWISKSLYNFNITEKRSLNSYLHRHSSISQIKQNSLNSHCNHSSKEFANSDVTLLFIFAQILKFAINTERILRLR